LRCVRCARSLRRAFGPPPLDLHMETTPEIHSSYLMLTAPDAHSSYLTQSLRAPLFGLILMPDTHTWPLSNFITILLPLSIHHTACSS
jgi:hypothetical protein